MNRRFKIASLLALCALAFSAAAGAADFDAQLLAIQQDWAVANYQLVMRTRSCKPLRSSRSKPMTSLPAIPSAPNL